MFLASTSWLVLLFLTPFFTLFSTVSYCLLGVNELYLVLRVFRATTCFFLDYLVTGVLSLIFAYITIALLRREGFLFSFIVFLIALGAWVIIVLDLYKDG